MEEGRKEEERRKVGRKEVEGWEEGKRGGKGGGREEGRRKGRREEGRGGGKEGTGGKTELRAVENYVLSIFQWHGNISLPFSLYLLSIHPRHPLQI